MAIIPNRRSKLPAHSTHGYPIKWMTNLSRLDHKGLLTLMNKVIQSDNTIGFVEPLNKTEGLAHIKGLHENVTRRRQYLLVAKRSDEHVGMVILTPSRLPNCRHQAALTCCIIHPRYRRKGILQEATFKVVEKCEELSIERLVIDVRTNSHGHKLWSKLGFEPFGQLDDYARIKGKIYSGTYMSISVERMKEVIQKDFSRLRRATVS
jgi:RimJ/RimL family protein N-acetyltransferase